MNGLWRFLFGFTSDDPGAAGTGGEGWTLALRGIPENIWMVLGLAAVFGFLGWLTVRTYRREGRTRPGVKGALAGLRLAVLLLVLLVILQPAVVTFHTLTRYSAVAVLLDDSLSMRWADVYVDDRDRAAMGEFLGALAGDLGGPDRPKRLDVVRHALARPGGPLAQLARDHPLYLYRFAVVSDEGGKYTERLTLLERTVPGASPAEAGGARVARGDPPRRAADQAIAHELSKLVAGGYQTNLGRALRDVLDDLEGHPVGAVVVVSDGQETGGGVSVVPARRDSPWRVPPSFLAGDLARDSGERLAAAAEVARTRGIPVYALAVGDPTPPRNVMVAQLQGPGDVRKGSSARFTAILNSRAYAGARVTVELLRAKAGTDAWERTGAAETVELAGGAADQAGDVQHVALTTQAPDVGAYVYKAAVEPLPDELIRSDNEATTTVRVSDEKVSVLLVSGDGGWEYQYLRNYLLKHPEHYKASIWQQNADPRFNQEASTGMKRSTLPITRDDLFAYDVIILYDPRYVPDSLDGQFLGLLQEFVSRHHGGLSYIVGNKFTDPNLLGGGPFDALAGLMPVVLRPEGGPFSADRGAPRTSWPLELTPEGQDHPLMQLAATAADNLHQWKAMPGVFRTHAVERLKVLASALAVCGDASRLVADGHREPVIAVQYYGKGRVLYLGTDETWRWRFVDGALRYERFWGNVMDFLAAGRLEKKRILITTGGETFDAGRAVPLRVEAYDRDFTPLRRRDFTLTMKREGTDEVVARPVLRATKPGFFEGDVLPEGTGTFELTAEPPKEGEDHWLPEDVSPRRIEVRLPQEEQRRPEANFQTLRLLAAEEPRFLRIWEADDLPRRIPPGKEVTLKQLMHPLWNAVLRLALLGAIGLVLLVEWTVRKVFSMV